MIDLKPARRVRYKGKNPRKFEEKYKELNPEKYIEDIEKIMARGATPVGTHRPICVDEILEILKPQPGQTILDATLGYGGHASHFIPRISPQGRFIGLDQDPIERPKTEKRLREKFPSAELKVGAINFKDARSFLEKNQIPAVDMVLADLGTSSMQIDDPQRGFSFKINAPLDLRMNPNSGRSAADLIRYSRKSDFVKMLKDYSDEIYAEAIAEVLAKYRPSTTDELTKAVKEVLIKLSPRDQAEAGDKPIRRTFQALRIAVNQELSVLDKFLEDMPSILKKGGRVAILTFHSGEDRRVKKAFQRYHRQGLFSEIADTPIRPSPEEQRSNPRSKSAKLRWAIF